MIIFGITVGRSMPLLFTTLSYEAMVTFHYRARMTFDSKIFNEITNLVNSVFMAEGDIKHMFRKV